jgi:DNA-binding transcriptional LysR family regulator
MARILSQSDLVAILCRRIAEAYVRIDKLQIRELPCPSPQVAIGMLWHRRLENQPAHKWLRELVEAACKRL